MRLASVADGSSARSLTRAASSLGLQAQQVGRVSWLSRGWLRASSTHAVCVLPTLWVVAPRGLRMKEHNAQPIICSWHGIHQHHILQLHGTRPIDAAEALAGALLVLASALWKPFYYNCSALFILNQRRHLQIPWRTRPPPSELTPCVPLGKGQVCGGVPVGGQTLPKNGASCVVCTCVI